MRLKSIELSGFKSFAKKTPLEFSSAVTAIVGPNGSGKSNVAESFRFVLGEQSMKQMRGRRGEDMIWNGSGSSPRAGRASVKLVFDNRDRKLPLDFDEVAIERVVHRDGASEYVLNGSAVRLRDIAELLATANIGASGHHIISQGEADRALSASPRERREMLEDALGLTAYLYKREEAQKKLEKTAENMREVESLRREMAPHLRFLQGQMKRIESAQKLREDLLEGYLEYFKRESVYLRVHKALLAEEREAPEKERKALLARVEHLREELGKKGSDHDASKLMALEVQGREASSRRADIGRELGRIEGELAAHERLSSTVAEHMPAREAREFAQRVEDELEKIATLDIEALKARLSALRIYAQEFLRRIASSGTKASHDAAGSLASKKAALEKELKEIAVQEERVAREVAALRQKIEGQKDASREAERELFAAMARRSDLEASLAGLAARAESLERDEAQFKRELGEAAILAGRGVLEYEGHEVHAERHGVLSDADIADEPRGTQEERRKKLERLKIRLEESGAGDSQEVVKEYKEATERDEFLERELGDLEASATSLQGLIEELTQTLSERFEGGIEKINKAFEEFFKTMFGGGSAALQIVKEKKLRRGASEEEESSGEDEDFEIEEGVDLSVSLPHKRVKGLHMLSGGERALTSIALIFAMSQVNPPPFLILDETDAALDEANSRRYGDMLETLAKHSQLIVITHNRETMSRAGVLYGITMGSDGVSKLLSVKFEEAVAVAK